MTGFRPRTIRPEDYHHFLLSFMPGKTRKLRPTGIHIFSLTYWADWLAPDLANGRSEIAVRYDVRDISRIFVQSSERRWEPVYLKHPRAPFSLRAHKAAQATLRAAGRATVDEDVIHEIREEQQALIAQASTNTKRARRQREREERGIETSTAFLPSGVAPPPRSPSVESSPPPAPSSVNSPTLALWEGFEDEVEIW